MATMSAIGSKIKGMMGQRRKLGEMGKQRPGVGEIGSSLPGPPAPPGAYGDVAPPVPGIPQPQRPTPMQGNRTPRTLPQRQPGQTPGQPTRPNIPGSSPNNPYPASSPMHQVWERMRADRAQGGR